MMKKTERTQYVTYARSALRGAVGLAVFLLLLFLAAVLSDNAPWIMNGTYPIAECCLLVAAIVSGVASLRRVESRRFLHALSGETGLICLVAAIAAFSLREGRVLALLIDLFLLLIGAFAGSILHGKRRIKQRGKR